MLICDSMDGISQWISENKYEEKGFDENLFLFFKHVFEAVNQDLKLFQWAWLKDARATDQRWAVLQIRYISWKQISH